MTLESTEETYIGGLTQASLKEVMRDTHRPGRKSGELLLPPVRGVHERAFEVKDEGKGINESDDPNRSPDRDSARQRSKLGFWSTINQ